MSYQLYLRLVQVWFKVCTFSFAIKSLFNGASCTCVSATDLREVSSDPKEQIEDEGPYHVSLSIEGMTCAACSSAITELVSELPDVSDLTVNLLGNSASMVVQRKELVDSVLVVIEDAGFGVAVISVAPTGKKVEPSNQSRTISLRVEGIPK